MRLASFVSPVVTLFSIAAVAFSGVAGRALAQNITVCNNLEPASPWKVAVSQNPLNAGDCVDFSPADPSYFAGCTTSMLSCQTGVTVSTGGSNGVIMQVAGILVDPVTGDTVVTSSNPMQPAAACASKNGRKIDITPAQDSLCPWQASPSFRP